MYKRELTDRNGSTWIRVDKRKARNLYNNGDDILISAENIDPFGIVGGATVNITETNKVFDGVVNGFTFYNCVNIETGYRPAFYIKGV